MSVRIMHDGDGGASRGEASLAPRDEGTHEQGRHGDADHERGPVGPNDMDCPHDGYPPCGGMGRFEGSVAPLLRSVRKLRGAAIPHNKYTRDLMTTVMPLPTRVVLPMQQHVGSQCEPLVKRRAHVDVGTRVGHSQARTTADIFSPVSGTVMEVRDAFYANGRADKVVVIEPDGGQTVDASVRRPQVTDYASLVEALKHSGIVGLGGAGFPTALKMDADFANIDLWLVNAAECEPFISSDFREMLEHPHDILLGIQTCLDLSGVLRALICIEDDKPEAIELLRRLCVDRPQIDVHVLPSRYPQGASRVLVRTVTGRAAWRPSHRRGRHALQRDDHAGHRQVPPDGHAPHTEARHGDGRRRRPPPEPRGVHRHAHPRGARVLWHRMRAHEGHHRWAHDGQGPGEPRCPYRAPGEWPSGLWGPHAHERPYDRLHPLRDLHQLVSHDALAHGDTAGLSAQGRGRPRCAHGGPLRGVRHLLLCVPLPPAAHALRGARPQDAQGRETQGREALTCRGNPTQRSRWGRHPSS